MSDEPLLILIVDDSPEDRATYRRSIARDEPSAYRFLEASLGEEGLALASRERPDCVLLDYNLPDLNGLGFLDRLRALDGGRTIPVVMLTGQGNEAIAVEALHRGAQDYVVKQIGRDDLRRVLHRAIEHVALDTQRQAAHREISRLAEERTALIEQLQQHMEELRASNRHKDEFLAVLAHELRNPLGPIRNATRILGIASPAGDGYAEARAVIERQVGHMGRLIDDLLDVSRIGRAQVSLRREPLDLCALARATAEDHRPGIVAAGQTLKLDLPGAPPWVDADATRIAQVIGNLLHNASKFTDAGGTITLAVRDAADAVEVRVSDTGIGMDAAQLSHAFETFNQADRSLDRSRGGLGLGLFLCKGLIELHGGQVRAQSDGVGKGCVIAFTVPKARAPAAAKIASDQHGRPPAKWRVLVIEDNVDAATTLATLLRVYGHQPRVAYDGGEGVEAAKAFRPDVVLCDIGLPGGMDGYAVARAVRASPHLRGAYLVAITGYGQPDDVQQARAAGFDLHLTKPVDPGRVQTLLATLSLPPDMHAAVARNASA